MLRIRSAMRCLFWISGVVLALSAQPAFAQCGVNGCEPGENCDNCIEDCAGQCCPDGICQSSLGEDCGNCGDCGCAPDQDCVSGSCVSACGRNGCETARGEDCASCPVDCGCPSDQDCVGGSCVPACGRNGCEPARGEDCASCTADCGCASDQECVSGSCVPSCGLNGCQPYRGENCTTCPADCACTAIQNCVAGACVPACGSNGCEAARGENCTTCPADCTCTASQNCVTGACVPACGSNGCEAARGENCATCLADCPCAAGFSCSAGGVCVPSCPNGVCEPALGEDRTTCSADCSDFYVRDWTTSAADHDDGAEPSLHSDIWHTCDVWNRTPTDAPGPLAADAPPENLDAAVTPAHNYAFTRVHRNAAAAAGSPAVDVYAQFFRANAGLGVNYVPVAADPSATLTFNVADTVRWLASGREWDLPITAYGPMCLAVEISAPGDPAKLPGILGGLPGVGMHQDNNKAQRNLNVAPAPWPAPSPLPEGARKIGFEVLVHNALVRPRDMKIQFTVAPDALEAFGEAEVAIVGGARQKLATKTVLEVPRVLPGENRWLSLRVDVPRREIKDVLRVHAVMDAETRDASGFTFGVRQVPLDKVWRDNVRRDDTLLRRARALGLPVLTRDAPGKLVDPANVAAYGAHARLSLDRLEKLNAILAQQGKTGPAFHATEELAALRAVAATDNAAAVAVAHARALRRLEALLTAHDLADGDEADIVQTVRWQAVLVARLKLDKQPFGKELQRRANEFVTAIVTRKARLGTYPSAVKAMMPDLQALVAALEPRAPGLRANLKRVEASLHDSKKLQGAHRQLLLAMQALAP